MKTGLTLNTFLPSKKLCNGQTHRKESLRKRREGAICNNMESFYIYIYRENKAIELANTERRKGKRKKK